MERIRIWAGLSLLYLAHRISRAKSAELTPPATGTESVLGYRREEKEVPIEDE